MSVEKAEVKEINKVIMGSIGTIAVALILGSVGMIYSSDKSNEVFSAKLDFIVQNMKDLKSDLKEMKAKYDSATYDRWTRTDHAEFNKVIQNRFFVIEKRLLKLESIK